MDLAAVFLLSLLGGYFFALTWRVTAFSTQKADGHHLYFRAAGFGVALFSLALGLRLALIGHVPQYARFDDQLSSYVRPVLKEEAGLDKTDEARREQWVITATYSLFLGFVCAGLLNVVTPRRWALRRSVDGLDKLLLDAQERALPVNFTLSSGKIYIGVIVDTPNPTREVQVTTIVPMFSGYRDPNGRMKLTTDYEKLYKSLEAGKAKSLGLDENDWISQFKLTFRADMISTASLFSPAVYAEFNPGWQRQIEQPDKHEPEELVVHLKRDRTATSAPPKPREITLRGRYEPRTSLLPDAQRAQALSETDIQRLNPQRGQKIRALMGWPTLEAGSFNIDLPDRAALDQLLTLKTAWVEEAASVIYPEGNEDIPMKRGPYLYYRGHLVVRGQPVEVMIRRPTNPIQDRIELLASFRIAEAIGAKPHEAVEVAVRSDEP